MSAENNLLRSQIEEQYEYAKLQQRCKFNAQQKLTAATTELQQAQQQLMNTTADLQHVKQQAQLQQQQLEKHKKQVHFLLPTLPHKPPAIFFM
jgi:multidrug resistance efflux pump